MAQNHRPPPSPSPLPGSSVQRGHDFSISPRRNERGVVADTPSSTSTRTTTTTTTTVVQESIRPSSGTSGTRGQKEKSRRWTSERQQRPNGGRRRKSRVSEAKILFCVLKNTHTNEPRQSWVENRGVGEMLGGSGPEDAKLVGCCSVAATAGWSDNWTSTLAASWVQLAASRVQCTKKCTHTHFVLYGLMDPFSCNTTVQHSRRSSAVEST